MDGPLRNVSESRVVRNKPGRCLSALGLPLLRCFAYGLRVHHGMVALNGLA